MKKHHILFDKTGDLKTGAKKIPEIKDYIESVPSTKSTFKLRDVGIQDASSVSDEHVEMAHCWRYSDKVHTGRERIYTNPKYQYANIFPALVMECECGVLVSRAYNPRLDPLDFESKHGDDCRSFYRHRVRADLAEESYDECNRLIKMGWTSSDLAPRFGCKHPSTLRDRYREWSIDWKDLRREFKRKASNTYHYIVHDLGYSASFAASLYPKGSRTLRRWYRKA